MGESDNILVLFASQTGNAEKAAKDLVNDKFMQHGLVGEVMSLDDFLELRRAAWTPLVVIISSSYGVGQAPLGGYRFREFCNVILANNAFKNKLEGLNFALLGLGDSKYTTFFQNPQSINDALLKAGATRVGPLGKADARDATKQLDVIEKWTRDIGPILKQTLPKCQKMNKERLKELQETTIEICRQDDGDFLVEPSIFTFQTTMLLVGVVLAFLAIVSAYPDALKSS